MGHVAVLWICRLKKRKKGKQSWNACTSIRTDAYGSKNQLTPAISLEVSTTITFVDSASFRVASRIIVDFPLPEGKEVKMTVN